MHPLHGHTARAGEGSAVNEDFSVGLPRDAAAQKEHEEQPGRLMGK